jgi:hypothetical protein
VRPRKDRRGVDLICDALPFGGLWYLAVPDAVEYAKFYSRSHRTVIRVYDEAGNVIETHEQAGDLLFSLAFCFSTQPLDLCVFGDPPGLRVCLQLP